MNNTNILKSEAIAKNLFVMADLKVPVICTVIGEGGSGGALAIGVGDRIMMLQYSTYSVISPEGCASILWKSADKAEVAADAMGITAKSLKELGLIDGIIDEPLGSAYRDLDAAARNIQQALIESVENLEQMGTDKLLDTRYKRLMNYGQYSDAS